MQVTGETEISVSTGGRTSSVTITVTEDESTSDTLMKDIGVEGGKMSIADVATVIFSPNTFSTSTHVILSKDDDGDLVEYKNVASALFGVSRWLEYNLKINTTTNQPRQPLTLELTAPAYFTANYLLSDAVVFAQRELSNENETVDQLYPVDAEFDQTKNLIRFRLDTSYFTSTRNAAGLDVYWTSVER